MCTTFPIGRGGSYEPSLIIVCRDLRVAPRHFVAYKSLRPISWSEFFDSRHRFVILLPQTTSLTPAETDNSEARFIVAVARSLHSYGTPSHQLEETLAKISRAMRLESQFLVTPTSIMMSVGEVPQQLTFLERVDAGETNLEKLNQLSAIIRQVVDGELSPKPGLEAVNFLKKQPREHGPLLMICGYTLACGTSAIFFGGGWRETTIAAVIGLLLGLLSVFAERHPRISGVVPVFGACLATLISRFVIHFWGPGEAFIGALGGLIVLVPGYTLTVAINEIAHRHLVSGTARVTGAAITFLQMGLGLALGSRLSDAFLAIQPARVRPSRFNRGRIGCRRSWPRLRSQFCFTLTGGTDLPPWLVRSSHSLHRSLEVSGLGQSLPLLSVPGCWDVSATGSPDSRNVLPRQRWFPGYWCSSRVVSDFVRSDHCWNTTC